MRKFEKKINVLLIFLQNDDKISAQPYYFENLGIQYIAAYLRENNIDVKLINSDGIKYDFDEIINIIVDYKTDLIGISACYNNMQTAIELTKRIKIQSENTYIVLGGQHASYFAVEILENESSVDYVISGEGEKSLLRLITYLFLNESFEVPGLYFRENNLIISQPTTHLQNLDNLPHPARDFLKLGIDNHIYTMPLILSSRGCPFNCAFCSTPDFFDGKWRARNYVKVVDEIESIIENFNLSHFYFTDDQILGSGKKDKEHILSIANEIISRKLNLYFDLYFFIMMRGDFPNILSNNEIKMLYQAGFKDFFIGFESGSAKSLKAFKKGILESQYYTTIKLYKKTLFIEGGFILFFPYTSRQSLLNDAQLIRYLNVPQWSYYTKKYLPYPGSAMYNVLSENGFFTSNHYLEISYEFIKPEITAIYALVKKIEHRISAQDYKIFLIIDAINKNIHSQFISKKMDTLDYNSILKQLTLINNLYYTLFVNILKHYSNHDNIVILEKKFYKEFDEYFSQLLLLVRNVHIINDSYWLNKN